MAIATPTINVPALDDLVQFADFHRVSLQAGDYEIGFKEELNLQDKQGEVSEEWATKALFSVSSERFTLASADIRSVFPPAGSNGDYWHVLPHVVLNRSTLPWERTSKKDGNDPSQDPPWLALLVIHPDDPTPSLQTTMWADARTSLGLPEETGDQASDRVQLLTLENTLATALLPPVADLHHLCHARRRLKPIGADQQFTTLTDAQNYLRTSIPDSHTKELDAAHLPRGYKAGWHLTNSTSADVYEVLQTNRNLFKCFQVIQEAATVLANRLPKPGARNRMYLVSLEERYNDSGLILGAANTSFVCLYQWDFYCEAEEKTLLGLLNQLNKNENGRERPSAWRISTQRLRDTNANVLKAVQGGWVPLRHRFREGSRSVSWYHGPLVPREPDTSAIANVWGHGDNTMDIRHADQLLMYDTDMGMYDVSYAAAWELGRLLTLQNTKLALQLLHWKRRHAHNLHRIRHLADYGYHLPVSDKVVHDSKDEREEAAIWQWLDELTELRHIPFNYLVPHADFLPPESIHFFTVDRRWIECLRDGAFSVGRVLATDSQHDNNLTKKDPSTDQLPVESGFLLRSQLIPGWPDLQVTAYNKREAPDAKGSLPDPTSQDVMVPIRMEKLAPDILLVLYPGEVKAVDFFLPPETLHFGLDLPTSSSITSDEVLKLVKRKRNNVSGKETSTTATLNQASHFRDIDKRIFNIRGLSTSLAGRNPSAGKLALQLVAGTTLVRFIRPTS